MTKSGILGGTTVSLTLSNLMQSFLEAKYTLSPCFSATASMRYAPSQLSRNQKFISDRKAANLSILMSSCNTVSRSRSCSAGGYLAMDCLVNCTFWSASSLLRVICMSTSLAITVIILSTTAIATQMTQ